MKLQKEENTQANQEDPLLVLLDKPHRATSITEEEIGELKTSLKFAFDLINKLELKLAASHREMEMRTNQLLNRIQDREIDPLFERNRTVCPICGFPDCNYHHERRNF